MEGIAYWVQCYLAQEVAERTEIVVKKTRIVEIAKWVDYQYDEKGRTTGIADEEMVRHILLHIPEAAVPAYINKKYRFKGDACVGADDCGPVIAWIKDEKRRRLQERRDQGKQGEPLAGMEFEMLEKLTLEHLPHLTTGKA